MENEKFQVLVQSPHIHIPCRAFTVNPNQTLLHLKHSLLPPSVPSETLDSLYFSFNGKPLLDSSKLTPSTCPPLSTLLLRFKLLGGGGDGGATGAESRDCYLNMYAVKKPDKADPNETRLSKWTTCALSSEPLNPPCVIDRLGSVFNKEPLVEALISKKLPKEFGHIKGLKDMIPIQLSLVPGFESEFETSFQCPISGLEFNGNYKFFALRGCGHVFSAKALKEVQSTSCLVCHCEFSEEDKIVINGNAEEVAALRVKIEDERAILREKKEKKVRNRVGEVGVGVGVGEKLSGYKHGVDGEAKVSAKVGREELGRILVEDGVKGKYGSAKKFKAADRAPANATREVYASIFTSSKKSDFKETYSCRSLPLGRN